jgi:hypothetical protein
MCSVTARREGRFSYWRHTGTTKWSPIILAQSKELGFAGFVTKCGDEFQG